MEKACRQCGQVRPLDEYYRSKKYSDGRDIYCKGCRDGRHAKWVAANKKPPKPKPTEKQCSGCGEVKPLTEFWSAGKGKKASLCKPCKTAYHYEYIARPEVAARLKEQARNRRSGTWKRPPRREPIGEGYEVCTMCNLDKPLDDFHRHKLGRNGRDSMCKECKRELARVRYRAEGAAERTHRRRVENRFGLERGQYDEMLAAHNGVCAICKSPPNEGRRLHVDHDHATGEIRGLLCYLCNAGIGMLRDDPALLRAAIQYLDKHQA